VADEAFDAVFLDLKLGADAGLDVLERILQVRPAPAVVIFTAYANIATAVEEMRRGAFDFIPKPFTPDQIRAVLAKVEKAATLQNRVRALEADLAAEAPPLALESGDPAMARALGVQSFDEACSGFAAQRPRLTPRNVRLRDIEARRERSVMRPGDLRQGQFVIRRIDDLGLFGVVGDIALNLGVSPARHGEYQQERHRPLRDGRYGSDHGSVQRSWNHGSDNPDFAQ
jgi:hypothetical protein